VIHVILHCSREKSAPAMLPFVKKFFNHMLTFVAAAAAAAHLLCLINDAE